MSQADHEIRIMAWTKSVFTGMWAKGFECCPSGWWFCVKDLQQNGVFLASTRARDGFSIERSSTTIFGCLPFRYTKRWLEIAFFKVWSILKEAQAMIIFVFFLRFLPVNCLCFPFNHPKNHGISKRMVWRSLKPPNFGESTPSFLEGLSWFLGQRWTYRNLEWYCKAKRGGRSRPQSKVMDWKREKHENTIGKFKNVES